MHSTDISQSQVTEVEPGGVDFHEVQRSSGTTFIAGSGLVMAVLQSICTAVVAINGVRLLIGLGALVMTSGLGLGLEEFHQREGLRIFFLVGALAGSLLTPAIIWRSHRLRNRPEAQWRKRPMPRGQKRSEYLQIALSTVTLVMVVVEEYLHFKLCHTL